MKRLHLDSLIAWAIALLIAVLAVSQLTTLAIIAAMRSDSVAVVEHFQIAERIADMVRVVEATPPAQRSTQLENFGGETLSATWDREPDVSEAATDSWRELLFDDAIGTALGGMSRNHRVASESDADGESVRETLRSGTRFARQQSGQVLIASILLSDGSWLNCRVPLADPAGTLGWQVIAAIACSGLVILLLSAWAVGRLARPLTVLAHAAEQLGRDVNAAPLPEQGSREMRQAARAFNTMQQRLRRFINDRIQMVAAISHDLRTPLTRLRLRAELSEDAPRLEKTRQDLAEMEAMIEATLSFAREEASPEPRVNVDLVSLVESVCDDMPAVSVHIEAGVPQRLTLHCQPLAMRRCIGNLVGNAVKYGQRARLVLAIESDAVVIHVDDDGPGIAVADQERVFEPFLRLDASRSRQTGGVGLGLTIARAAARAHGGEILLANRSGGGLRAIVRLPAPIAASRSKIMQSLLAARTQDVVST